MANDEFGDVQWNVNRIDFVRRIRRSNEYLGAKTAADTAGPPKVSRKGAVPNISCPIFAGSCLADSERAAQLILAIADITRCAVDIFLQFCGSVEVLAQLCVRFCCVVLQMRSGEVEPRRHAYFCCSGVLNVGGPLCEKQKLYSWKMYTGCLTEVAQLSL